MADEPGSKREDCERKVSDLTTFEFANIAYDETLAPGTNDRVPDSFMGRILTLAIAFAPFPFHRYRLYSDFFPGTAGIKLQGNRVNYQYQICALQEAAIHVFIANRARPGE